MPLPAPNLDDRSFQQIVDQAKSMIAYYCPEWTDHNVSDPGVTLIELFAWMTELLLYRVNQVPDKVYIAFMELLGMRLEQPRAAVAPVTFYLSAAQSGAVTIPASTEVATVRTETNPAIIFTTASDLTIQPPQIVNDTVLTADASSSSDPWQTHDLRRLTLMNQRIALFPERPAARDGFYIPLQADHSHHVLALIVRCQAARGAGVRPDNPPLEWHVSQGGQRWGSCMLEFDGTRGFSQAEGEIILRLPAMTHDEYQGIDAFWLCCRLLEPTSETGAYKVSPEIESIQIESRGGTVNARHAVTIENEVLGRSDGTPGQTFRLQHTPLLARDPSSDYLLVEPPDGEPQPWQEVNDFADSHAEDQHYTLDNLDGTLTLGPALLQPDGTVYHFGAVPEKGSLLRFSRYQYGGGILGNVPAGALSMLKSSIPYVARVSNWLPARGGQDAQSLDDARARAPGFLRTRTRAVTADDYEYLASRVIGVQRARCIAPGAQPGSATDPKPGQVNVVVLPRITTAPTDNGQVHPDELKLTPALRDAVRHELEGRCLLGTTLTIQQPTYIGVSVHVVLRLPESSDQYLQTRLLEQAETSLYRYLNPYTGGPRGDGWPFGRNLHLSEIYALLQRLNHVEFVDSLTVTVEGSNLRLEPGRPQLQVPPEGLIYSLQHRVSLS